MIATQLLLAGFIAAASATALASEEVIFAKLLKRQEPGTPAYACHDACTAITVSRQPNPCENEIFLADYEICLTCSGPDNFNIWRYYGGSLSTIGTTCGLETEPKSGKQPDPSEVVHASSTTVAPAASTPAPAATSEEPTTAPASETPEPAPTSDSPTTAAPAPSTPAATSGSPATPAVSSSVSGVPTSHTNGTASFTSSPPEQTVNAAANLGVANGVFGAVFVAAVLGM
ncbi:Nn.00g101450.m01.CDS01 [Neocucurbitaria sp. VM-36]